MYRADVSELPQNEVSDSLAALRDVIERRVNIFGVSEPVVQVEERSDEEGTVGRLIVELPGVTDVDEATKLIGQTPVLDFRFINQEINFDEVTLDAEKGELILNGEVISPDDLYIPSGVSGKHIQKAQVQFDQLTGEPLISLIFTNEGSDLFEEITEKNIGERLAVFLDGEPIIDEDTGFPFAPTIQSKISGGRAQITGIFTLEETKALVGKLNAGALPVPISLLSTQTIGASLGQSAVEKGVQAGLWGLVLVILFFVLWYRVPGVLAVISLIFYVLTMFAIFKLIPVTLTAAGIAGFILSIGLAVDANVLIFERLKEERREKKNFQEAATEAFSRAWPSIRDANVTSILTAVILYYSTTSLIKGFALTFGLGVLVSMFSAIVFTKALLLSLNIKQGGALFNSGFTK